MDTVLEVAGLGRFADDLVIDLLDAVGLDTWRGHRHELVDRMPTAELEVLPGVGHAPWFDEPDYTAEATSNFLAP